MTSEATPDQEVLFTEQGALGRLTLNRPKALNSLTLGMVRSITAALEQWRHDERIQAVLIEGAGERGLCAGGDIRTLYDAAKAGDEALPRSFWAEEYRMNAMLARYPKPVVGIMDGICMGGGVGISAHGSHRVVTERSKVGMPETGIGFFPDVGGTYLLSRTPGELGTHMALTGEPVGAGDALYCGLADHYVAGDNLDELITALSTGAVDTALEKYAEKAPESPLEAARTWIDAAYSADTVEEIVQRLRQRSEEAAHSAADAIETKSPTSLKVTLRSLRSAAGLHSLEQALDEEFRVSLACVRIGDFVEGVRATLVDKDRNPAWSPERLEEVDDTFVAEFFETPATGELGLSG
ncbi:enoyl-CoA hydratase/isomerase family protein [Haloactinomyces albus]|uniref:3-hydroxyisobutyryl-CoA hydrolase n=1 Tax=Haloactinomyces albus TaxID=1352928 RepID=A0AAE3ZCV7_9ACTN|nr:enoyl-CoA hydratase/isomerase family protein [Haloactinomyces albus]MDR7300937.1 enoyl-CoA hydratase [Haloactinomyces albus]